MRDIDSRTFHLSIFITGRSAQLFAGKNGIYGQFPFSTTLFGILAMQLVATGISDAIPNRLIVTAIFTSRAYKNTILANRLAIACLGVVFYLTAHMS